LGAARIACQRWEESAAASERGLSILRAGGTGRHWESRGLALLAEALAGAGDASAARTYADEAEAASLRAGNRTIECLSCLAIARTRRMVDGIAASSAIAATLDRVDALVSATGAQLYTAWVHEERALLAKAFGDEEEWRRELSMAQRQFAAMGADAHVARLAAGDPAT
jgi:hypothetical protein